MACVVFNHQLDASRINGVKSVKLLLNVLNNEIVKQTIFRLDVNFLLIG